MTTAEPVPDTQAAAYRDGSAPAEGKEQKSFRFYDNRQRYLMFVNTCSEKSVIGERIEQELDKIAPRPPALRFFDAGTGDGTVLAHALRSMHLRFEHAPFYVAGKEISVEDVRLTLEKMPDRFLEHPETVLAVTNISYADAPWLHPSNPLVARRLHWHEIALEGRTSAEFQQQLLGLQPFLSQNWKTRAGPSGGLIPDTPAVLVIYRKDCRFLLDHVIPKQGQPIADFDLILASQPYRLRAPTEFKARRILAPLARALGPGGRLLGIHSAGADPGLEIVQKVWPEEDPFGTSRHGLLEATRAALGDEADRFDLAPSSDEDSVFRYHMHTMPDEIDSEASSVGTSTLLAAWNAATYVAQIEDERLTQAMGKSDYLDATLEVLSRTGKLWFNDESYVIARRY
jgi:SAM-dependent methyltransferase